MRFPFSTFIRTSRQRISRRLGIGKQTLLRARCRLPAVAREAADRAASARACWRTVERRDARDRHQQRRHARRQSGDHAIAARTTATLARNGPIGRATIGSPESQRSRSSATASADA